MLDPTQRIASEIPGDHHRSGRLPRVSPGSPRSHPADPPSCAAIRRLNDASDGCFLRPAPRCNMDFMRTRLIWRMPYVGLTAAALLLALGGLALAADEEAKLLPDGPGKDLVGRMCFDCHGRGNFR